MFSGLTNQFSNLMGKGEGGAEQQPGAAQEAVETQAPVEAAVEGGAEAGVDAG